MNNIQSPVLSDFLKMWCRLTIIWKAFGLSMFKRFILFTNKALLLAILLIVVWFELPQLALKLLLLLSLLLLLFTTLVMWQLSLFEPVQLQVAGFYAKAWMIFSLSHNSRCFLRRWVNLNFSYYSFCIYHLSSQVKLFWEDYFNSLSSVPFLRVCPA